MPKELIPHLFRTEYSKIVAVLCKTYGLASIDLAEDVVSDTFLKATETWSMNGVPKNPTAWLYTVAKNRTKDHFRRAETFQTKIEKELLHREETIASQEIDLSSENIKDCLLYTSPSPRDKRQSRMPSSA